MPQRPFQTRTITGGGPPVAGVPWERVPISAAQVSQIAQSGDPATVFGGSTQSVPAPSGRVYATAPPPPVERPAPTIVSGGRQPVPGFPWTPVPITEREAALIAQSGDPASVFPTPYAVAPSPPQPTARAQAAPAVSGGAPPVPGYPWTQVPISGPEAAMIAETGDPGSVFGDTPDAVGMATETPPDQLNTPPWVPLEAKTAMLQKSFLSHVITDPRVLNNAFHQTPDGMLRPAVPEPAWASDIIRVGSILPDMPLPEVVMRPGTTLF